MRGYVGLQIATIGYNFITMENANRTKIPSAAESEVGCSAVKKQVVPHDMGKPSERRGRKGTGLGLEMAIIAGLPKEESVVRLFLDATRRERLLGALATRKELDLAGLKITIPGKGGE